ncbi:MAG: adenylate kinase family protein [Acidimicrobiales bacterium]
MPSAVRLVILGRQGAGKGTQCLRLARHYAVPHVATGDMLRAMHRSGSELARRLATYMRAGELVPDEVVIAVVAHRLGQDDTQCGGFILEGFPRTAAQAEGLSALLAPSDIDLCLDLEVDPEVVLARLSKRRVCRECSTNYSVDRPPRRNWTCDVCGGEVRQRDDDTEEAITRRLALYEAETAPLVAWYRQRDKLVIVKGSGAPDTVTTRLVRAIDHRVVRTEEEGAGAAQR